MLGVEFKPSRVVVTLVLFVAASHYSAPAQSSRDLNNLLSKTFWTRVILATSGDCKIQITPNDLSPNQNNCHFGDELEVSSKVKIRSVKKERGWSRLRIETKLGKTNIYLRNTSVNVFRKSLFMFFSRSPLTDPGPSCQGSTKAELIRNLGFPSVIHRDGDSETWELSYAWGGRIEYCDGYDTARISILKGMVKGIGGTL
jgi:hypothetical protein